MSEPLVARRCSEVPAAPVRWLWPGALARGRLAVLDCAASTAAGPFVADLAARLSAGGPLPGGRPLDYAHASVLVSALDDPADTVCPRLRACGANPEKVLVGGGPSAALPPLPGCAAELRRLVTEHCADLLVLDPLAAFLPKGDERRALAPLAELAAETGCAVLLCRTDPRGAARGALGAYGAARTALVLAPHPDDADLWVLAVSKSAYGAPPPSLSFRVRDGAGPEWCGPTDLSADELCGAPSRAAHRPRDRAAAFLNELLANGPRPVLEIQHLAAKRCLSWATVERAKAALGVRATRERAGEGFQWCWNHPDVYRAEREQTAAMNAMQRYLHRKEHAPLPYDGKHSAAPS
jgi:putative DNA primase/helicase